ncbi:MAG: hypothetical protein ACD_19C00004G0002 [uncultured bacterium]|nr:MAG: hypothetical protein ACD_19C00004G0002 [uncultured bacterium]
MPSPLTQYVTPLLVQTSYPFENSPFTERGYWDKHNNYFVFRNFKDYELYLRLRTNQLTNRQMKDVYRHWEILCDSFLNKHGLNKKFSFFSHQLIFASLYLRVHCSANKKTMKIENFLDQKVENFGYSVSFCYFIHNFINQRESSQTRLMHGKYVSILLKTLRIITRENFTEFKELTNYYKLNQFAIEFIALKKSYKKTR